LYEVDESQVSSKFGPLLGENAQFYVAWTRLTVPQQGSTHLKRPRLVDMLHNMIDRKLILIRAPAGYGKTSLLVDLAHETDLRVCWYTVESQDSDLSTFLNHFIASIARRFPSFGQRSVRLLQSMGGQVHARLRVFVAALVDEIFKQVPEYFFLTLDDYHTLNEASHVHEFVQLLLDFMPEQCHLIVASRTVPPLPLIRLAARQQMAAIGVDDLRFSEPEIRQLTEDKLGATLSVEQIQLLAQQTDGWITALLLGADTGWNALLRGEMSPAADLTELGIYDYLMNEVFSCQPLELQRFMLHTAVLSELTVSLCNELVDQDCRAMLRMLERHNLFILRVEEAGVEATYRYHPLFRDFLLARLREQSESLYRDLNIRAADLFAKHQNWYVAVRHNLEAGRFDQVKQIILSHYDDLNRAGLRESVAHWIDALPLEYVSADLQINRARFATELGEIDTALRLYTNAIVFFESQETEADLAFALTERSYALSKSGHYSDAIQDCQQALSLIENDEHADSLRGRAYRYLGIFYGEMTDPESWLHYSSLAHQCWERCGESVVRMARLAQDMGAAYGMQGQPTKTIEQCTQALSIWTRLGNDGEIAFTLNNIGVAHHRLEEYQDALSVLHDALQKSQAAGAVRAEAWTLVSLGDLYRDLGQFDQALVFYEQGHHKAHIIGEPYLYSYIESARTETLCLAGQIEDARIAIEHALSQKTLSKRSEANYRLLFAATLLHQQESERARQELVAALTLSGGNNDLTIRGHIRLAQAAMLENHHQETTEHLHTAFELAQEAGLTQPLSVESLHYLQVLQFAAKKGGKSQKLKQWIASAKKLERVRKQVSYAGYYKMTADPDCPDVQINALGRSQVLKDGEPVSWRTNQAKALFFYLLTHPNGQTKEQIGAVIWPDHPPAKLFSIFRSSLFRVRKALFSEIVLFEDDRYRLNPQVSYRYDVQAFEQEISKGTFADNPAQKVYHYRRALGLYHGEFLTDLYAEWVLSLRETLQARHLQALTFLAEFHLDRGDCPQAIQFARQILTVDKYHELAYYVLVRAYARSGQRPQAKRIYEQCCDMLAKFDLSPQKGWKELLQ
jgi:ATP/maltotriose-dependent transcriptional regulator MalT